MRRTVPLISPTTELDLIEFLKHYKRLSADKVCTQPIDVSQVSVWTFKGGVWTHGVPDRAVRNGSWCQSYLTSALNLSRNEYDRAKQELFAQTNGLNGVYKHKSDDLFAIVYRPSPKLSNSTKAAIAGGLVLAGGLGLAGTRYALQAPTRSVTPTTQESKPAPLKPQPNPLKPPKPDPPKADWTQQLEEHYKRVQGMCSDEQVRVYLNNIDPYEVLIEAQKKLGYSVDRYTEQVERWRSLAGLGMSLDWAKTLLDGGVSQAIESKEFKESRNGVCEYFEKTNDDVHSRTCRAARIYLDMIDRLKKNESAVDDIQKLFGEAMGPKENSPAYEVLKLLGTRLPRNSAQLRKLQESVDEFLSAEVKYEDWVNRTSSGNIQALTALMKNKEAIPVFTDDAQTRWTEFRDIWYRLEFYNELRAYILPGRGGTQMYVDSEKVNDLFERLQALSELGRSQSDAIDDMRKFNKTYTPLSVINPFLFKVAYSLRQSGEISQDDLRTVTDFIQNKEQIDIYSKLTGQHSRRDFFDYSYKFSLGNAFLPVLTQLTRDLNVEPPKFGVTGLNTDFIMDVLKEKVEKRASYREKSWNGDAWA